MCNGVELARKNSEIEQLKKVNKESSKELSDKIEDINNKMALMDKEITIYNERRQLMTIACVRLLLCMDDVKLREIAAVNLITSLSY